MRHLREIVTKERERERERRKDTERETRNRGGGDVVATYITAATMLKPSVTSFRPTSKKKNEGARQA